MRLLLLPLLVLFPLTSVAADLAAAVSQCAAVSDSGQRLACFDRLAASVAPVAAPTAPAAAAPVAVTTSAAAQSPTAAVAAVAPEPVVPAATPSVQAPAAPAASERFGLEHKPQAAVEELEQIRATVVKRSKDPYGKWVITLDNGQVWKQSESTSFSFPSEQVTIERGVLGAFYLRADGQNKTIKVKRQQ